MMSIRYHFHNGIFIDFIADEYDHEGLLVDIQRVKPEYIKFMKTLNAKKTSDKSKEAEHNRYVKEMMNDLSMHNDNYMFAVFIDETLHQKYLSDGVKNGDVVKRKVV